MRLGGGHPDDRGVPEPTSGPAGACTTCNGRIWSVRHGRWIASRETVGMVCQTCGTDYAPVTAVDVDALDKLREAIRDDLAGWPIGSGYYSTEIGTDDAGELAHFLLAGSLEPLLAEVRRGRALRELHNELRHRLKALVDEWDAMARNLHHIPVAEAYADVVIGLRAVVAAVDGGGQS